MQASSRAALLLTTAGIAVLFRNALLLNRPSLAVSEVVAAIGGKMAL